ncbi:MAG: DinB family protein, partial [Gemmatimonadaceae bacterium]
PAANPGIDASRMTWTTMSQYVVAAAEQIPEADYSFRPVETVRTIGELIGHVAGAQNMLCAAALGEAQPGEDAVEKAATTKATLVAALKASNEYCNRAYAMSDAASAGMTKLFGQDRSKAFVLTLNGAHTGEHYGNVVTYMRIKGMVPPSSQPQQ